MLDFLRFLLHYVMKHPLRSLGGAGALLFLYKLASARKYVAEITSDNKSLTSKVLGALPKGVLEYTPTPWATNPHLQIVMSVLLPHVEALLVRQRFEQQLVDLPDGGQLALDWAAAGDLPADAPVMVILPGLTSSSSSYHSLCKLALSKSYRPVVFHKRGHAPGVGLGTPATSKVLQGFGDHTDFEHCLRVVRESRPSSQVFAVGFSAGSGLLASFTTVSESADKLLDGAAFVSAGYDAQTLFQRQAILPFYDRLMTKSLKNLMSPHLEHLEAAGVDVKAMNRTQRIHQFDDAVYRVIGGHSDLDDYWLANNPMRAWEDNTVPSLAINALDDPICPGDQIPFEKFAAGTASASCALITVPKGSHTAFFQGVVPVKWDYGLVVAYFDALQAVAVEVK